MKIINLENTFNTRSLSYLKNKENKRIKNNLIIRSDNLSKLNSNDINILKNEYNLKNIIDLRTNKESSHEPDVNIDGVNIYLNPILEDDKIGITKTENVLSQDEFIKKLYSEGIESSLIFMENTYNSFVTSDFATKAYKKFIDLLLTLDGPILFHCSAGKDRAGFAAVLILSILDFDYKDILEDYLYTNYSYKTKIETEMNKFGAEYKGILECVYGVKEEYIDSLLKYINTVYKSFDNYLYECLGIDESIKNKLKEKYLVIE